MGTLEGLMQRAVADHSGARDPQARDVVAAEGSEAGGELGTLEVGAVPARRLALLVVVVPAEMDDAIAISAFRHHGRAPHAQVFFVALNGRSHRHPFFQALLKGLSVGRRFDVLFDHRRADGHPRLQGHHRGRGGRTVAVPAAGDVNAI